jgi:hypothetical protein
MDIGPFGYAPGRDKRRMEKLSNASISQIGIGDHDPRTTLPPICFSHYHGSGPGPSQTREKSWMADKCDLLFAGLFKGGDPFNLEVPVSEDLPPH